MKDRIVRIEIVLTALSCASALFLLLTVFLGLRTGAQRAAVLVASFTLALVSAFLVIDVVRQHAPGTPKRCWNGDEASVKTLYDRIVKLMETKQVYLDDDYSLSDLASAVCSNKSKVSKAINTYTGQNFCQFLNKYRMEYALDLMQRDPRLKSSEVSYMSGFHSNGTFHKTFKMYMEGTPSEYMRKIRARTRYPSRMPGREQ